MFDNCRGFTEQPPNEQKKLLNGRKYMKQNKNYFNRQTNKKHLKDSSFVDGYVNPSDNKKQKGLTKDDKERQKERKNRQGMN